MKRNLKRKPNNVFAKFECSICLGIFDGEEYIYETTYGKGLACYNCAKETEKKIMERIDKKIEYLKRSKEILLK